jgi:hypothetical protein
MRLGQCSITHSLFDDRNHLWIQVRQLPTQQWQPGENLAALRHNMLCVSNMAWY